MTSKILAAAAILALTLVANANAHNDPNEPRVEIEALNEGAALKAGAITFQFQLVDTKANRTLGEKDLTVENEKILHFIAYDPALKEFQHVHPSYDGSVWSVSLNLSVNGNYWLWAQGKLASDGTEFSASTRQLIEGGKPENSPALLGDHRSGSDGNSVATLSSDALQSGEMAMLTLSFSRVDGSAPVITNYLGNKAHIIIVSDDGDALIHAHPMEMGGELMLHTTFPGAGHYRIWIQFMDLGELKTVSLSVTVSTASP